MRRAALCALLAPQAAHADAVTLHGDAVDLAVSTVAQGQSQGQLQLQSSSSTPTVGGQADLTGRLNTALQAAIHLQIQASDTQAQAWTGPLSPAVSASPANASNSGKLGFNAAWTPSSATKLEVDMTDEFHRSLQWAAPYLTPGEDQDALSRQQSARAALSLQPLRPLTLQLGGETSRDIEQTSVVSPGSAAFTWSETGAQRAFSTVKWTLIPGLSLEGGGAAEIFNVGWRGADAGLQNYAYLTPKAAANLAAWPGGQLQISVERVVSPVNATQFGSFIDTAERPLDAAAFQPDHEWRYTGKLDQKLAGVDLSASYIHALLQSVTDFGPAGAGQAPMSIGGGQRDQLDLGLNAPLEAVGLASATLTGKASWRASRVIDPFTQTPRRLSGETPYQAEINLAQSLPAAHLRLGVKAQVSGAQTTYQMSQLSTLSPTGGLGGFLDYSAAGVAIHLQLDNLVGGGRTDRETYFIGSRSLDDVDRAIDTRQDSRAVAISLQKPF